MKALMIDIETFGLIPTSAVHQIGFCGANLETGEMLVPPTNLFVQPQPQSDMDFETLCWWMQQSNEARAAVFPPDRPRVTAGYAYNELRYAYRGLGGAEAGVTVWASPAMFDLPILSQTFAAARNDTRESKPWPYYMERDLMTLYKMLDPEKRLKPVNPVEHDAASDAKAQMEHLIAIFKHNATILKGAK